MRLKRMKSHVERTARKGILGTFGGFGVCLIYQN